MNVKFFLRHGVVIDWPVPDPAQFNFVVMAKAIRADGCFVAPNCYIPHDEIAAIGLDSEQHGPIVTMPAPTAPAPSTKQ